jgi:hypothetical protein
MPGDRTLLNLDASHVIPTRVLRFEDSGLHRRTPVRPVLLNSQTGTYRSDRSDPPVRLVLLTDQTGTYRSDPPVRLVWSCCSTVFGSSVLALWINQGT